MKANKGLRARKSEEAKQAFYEAAMTLFRKQGFEETSVEEIAELAGYSRATFFNHFGTKKGVLRFYGQDLQRRVEARVGEIGEEAEPLDLLREVLLIMAREAEVHSQDLRLIFKYSIRDPEYLAKPTAARRGTLDLITGLLLKAQKAGKIRADLPAFEQAYHVMALYQGAALAVMAGLVDAEKSVASIWAFLHGGLTGGHPAA